MQTFIKEHAQAEVVSLSAQGRRKYEEKYAAMVGHRNARLKAD